MPSVLLAVNADFAVRNSFGARAWHIAEALSANEPLVLCRGYDRARSYGYPVHVVGLGRTLTRILTGINVYLWRGFPNSRIRNAVFSRATRRFLRRNTDTITLVHSWVGFPHVLSDLRARNPRVVTIYDVSITPDCAIVQSELNAFDYFTAPSQHIVNTLIGCGIEPQRIFLIPFGVDVDLFQPAPDWPDRMAPRAHGTSPAATAAPVAAGPLRVAFTGQLCARKGIPELITAWKSLDPARTIPGGAELHLYGRLNPEVNAHLADRDRYHIHLHGFTDLTAELPANHLYVLPSHREGSAKSVYEALACGLPVITTEETGSVVRDGVEGFIVPAGDPQTLAARLSTLLTDAPLRLRMATAARTRSQEFTWQRYGESVVSVYRNLFA